MVFGHGNGNGYGYVFATSESASVSASASESVARVRHRGIMMSIMTAPHEPPIDHLLTRFARTLEGVPASRGRGALLAVSGGPDSTALLRLFQMLRDAPPPGLSMPCELVVCHVHHGIRSADADGDARFVERLAREHDMRFVLERIDAPALARAGRRSLEDAAREARYEILARRARGHGARLVATGHTAGDQEETVLLRIARGCGLRGLGGIRSARPLVRGERDGPWLVRPLIDWSRDEVLAFLDGIGQPFRSDATNEDIAIPRNAVRHIVLPALREHVHPGVSAALLRLAAHARELDADLDAWCAERETAVRLSARDGAASLAYSLPGLMSLPPSLTRRMLERAVERLAALTAIAPPSLTAAWFDELHRRTRGATRGAVDRIALGSGWRLVVGEGVLVVEAPSTGRQPQESEATPDEREAPLMVPGEAHWRGWRVRVDLLEERPDLAGTGPLCEIVDAESLPHTLLVRGRRPGERFHPLGSPGSKKLKEHLRESRVPPAERDQRPLVVAGDELVWVVGTRIGHRFRVTGMTRVWARLRASRG